MLLANFGRGTIVAVNGDELHRLAIGGALHFNLSESDLSIVHDIVIVAGETEEEIMEQLRDVVGDDVTVDDRRKNKEGS